MPASRAPLLAGLVVLALLVLAGVLAGLLVGGALDDRARSDPGDAASGDAAADEAESGDAAGGDVAANDAAAGDAEVAGPPDGTRPDGVPSDAVPATVERVVDGDTLRVRLPGAADGDATSVPIRLLNIDTPELARDGQPAECLAEQASARAAELAPPGAIVWLAADREERDRFDRLLRAVWTVEGVFVNETLVAEGYAEAILVRPNDRFDATMRAAERVAQREGVGIWGAACAA